MPRWTPDGPPGPPQPPWLDLIGFFMAAAILISAILWVTLR